MTILLEQIENDTVDVDAMLAANPMGGPASTNPGLGDMNKNKSGPGGIGAPGGAMPDFNKMMEEQQAKNAESAVNTQEKAERMMQEAIAKANSQKAIDVEATPSSSSAASEDFQVTKESEEGEEEKPEG